METAVLCPGQGALSAQAGRAWVDHPAWATVARIEEALDRPVAPLLLTATDEELAFTDAAQLATLALSLVGWEALRRRLPHPPAAFAGHSLGQVTALIAAEAVDFDEGVRLAASRADATRRADDARPGRLAALVGIDLAGARAACTGAGDDCWIAIDNAPGQVVIGGGPEAVDRAMVAARDHGAKGARLLAVGAAFHTPWMAAAADELGPAFSATAWRAPAAPVVANVDGRAHAGADGWAERLTRQLVEPVLWTDSQRTLAEMGVTHAVELPPAGTLRGLARRTIPAVEVLALSEPADLDAITG